MKRKTHSYFKKVKRGELTVENAAEKLGCPCYQFQKEFEKYYDPFSESSHGFRILDGVTILTFLITIVSILIQFNASLTSERAYHMESQPELNIQEDIITLYWDDTGKLKYVGDTIIEDQFYQDSNSIIVPSINVFN